jgi:hypothetical protein
VRACLRKGIRFANGAVVLSLVVSLAGCASGSGEPRQPQPGSSAPLQLSGQRVLVLPVQASLAVPVEPSALEGEIVFALTERDPRVGWVVPEEVRRAARRSPLFAGNPDALPGDPMTHHGERRVLEPLAGELRRYSALIDARLVLLPRLIPAPEAADGSQRVRLSSVVVDARSGDVVWWAEQLAPSDDLRERAGIAGLAGELAVRLLAAGGPR